MAPGRRRLFGVGVFSNKGSAQWIQIFDGVNLPADGAAPFFVATVAAASNLGLYWGSQGRWFDVGIVICNSTTAATKTIGAADCFFDVQYY